MSSPALGLFRMVFAAGWAAVVLRTLPPAAQPLCLALLALFGAGILARLSFALFVMAFTGAHLGTTGEHAVALPLKTLWLMMIVPWEAGLSVDRLALRLAGRPPAPARSRAYGLAAWIPVLMIGLGYAAAAFAKIDEVGPRWITGGAVKYFFLTDAHNAPVQWGRFIARSDVLSVLFSAAAVAGESSVVLAAIWPYPAVVLAAGVVAFALHLGFYVFQGVWWDPWWALLPAFLPWEWIASALRLSPRGRERVETTSALRRFSPAIGVVLLLAVLQQPIASLLRVTYGFALSDFPMYSNVYFSTREEVAAIQEAMFQPAPLIRFALPGSVEGDEPLLRDLERDAALSDAARKIFRGETLTDEDAARVQTSIARYAGEFGARRRIDVLADTWKFDWSVADFVPRHQWKPLATVSLDEGVIEVRKP